MACLVQVGQFRQLMICKSHISDPGTDFVPVVQQLLDASQADDAPVAKSVLKGSDEEKEVEQTVWQACNGVLDGETGVACGLQCERLFWIAGAGKNKECKQFCKASHLYRYLAVRYLAQGKVGTATGKNKEKEKEKEKDDSK